MTDLQIKLLSANNNSTLEIDKYKIGYKIQKEHVFVSVEDALNGIEDAIKNNINPDLIQSSNPKGISQLQINIIDDAVCSIIYEIQQLNLKEKLDDLITVKIMINNFYNDIIKKIDHDKLCKVVGLFLSVIIECMENDTNISNIRLSYAYYNMMGDLYRMKTPDPSTSIILKYYWKLIEQLMN